MHLLSLVQVNQLFVFLKCVLSIIEPSHKEDIWYPSCRELFFHFFHFTPVLCSTKRTEQARSYDKVALEEGCVDDLSNMDELRWSERREREVGKSEELGDWCD